MSTSPTVQVAPLHSPPQRDWFGYILTGFISVVVAAAGVWYPLYLAEKQATAAEKERMHAVRQSVIAIVEDQALNGRRLEADRIHRLLDQRRREQNVLLQVSAVDVIEQAEFNITSSRYLSVERKEQIKPIFDAVYADVAARSFQEFAPGARNSELLNELAKQIQEGKTAQALANLKRLHLAHSNEMWQLTQRLGPTLGDVLKEVANRPVTAALLAVMYGVLVAGISVVLRRYRLARRVRNAPLL